MFSDLVENDSNLTCTPGILFNNNSGSLSLRLSNPYGGIPENLLWNAVGWTALVASFGLLRRLAGNYGVLGALQEEVEQNNDSPWTQLFFHQNTVSSTRGWLSSLWTPISPASLSRDAAKYLNFQRHLILLVSLLTASSLGIILPLNFSGDLQGSSEDFGHTTISNLRGTDPRLWAHVLISLSFLPIGIALMRRFTNGLKEGGDAKGKRRTLMLARVPRSFCSDAKLTAFLSLRAPSADIEEINIARDVSRLHALEEDWRRAREARLYCENNGRDLTLRRRPCANREPAHGYYMEREKSLYQQLLRMEAIAKNGSIGVAFVSFKDSEGLKMATKGLMGPWKNPDILERELKPWKWRVCYAPPPEDIIWENLDYDSQRWFLLKMVIVNLSLFGLLFVFTSPAVVLSQLQLFLKTLFGKDAEGLLPAKINDFVPTLLLWTFSALLPNAVAVSDTWLMGHWRRSVENIWIMRKTFFYLLFMVLILPSVGLTSLLALARVAFSKGPQWDCIFLPDSGAFFVNYVITSSLVGTALELIRFSELFLYAMRVALAKSGAEIASIRRTVLYEFPFGYNYGWMLLIFALTVSYAVVCPLITPFGLFYMVMKHGVDRYNLSYAYKRSKINNNIHFLAVNCVILSFLFSQVILLFFNVLRSGSSSGPPLSSNPRAIFSIAALVLSVIAFVANMAHGYISSNGSNPGSGGHVVEVAKGAYVPKVLSEDIRPSPPTLQIEGEHGSGSYGALNDSPGSNNNYGSLQNEEALS